MWKDPFCLMVLTGESQFRRSGFIGQGVGDGAAEARGCWRGRRAEAGARSPRTLRKRPGLHGISWVPQRTRKPVRKTPWEPSWMVQVAAT
jgi:hypothetical protein